VLQGLIRHIEYSSNADVAYDTAVSSAAAVGFGFFRLVTEYEGDSFDQCIKFRRIRNPFTVNLDPASEEPDGSDARFAIISTKVPKDEFKRLYPDAEASTEMLGRRDGMSQWLWDDFVRVAEYYRVEHVKGTLVQLTNGETGWKDKLLELPRGVAIARERTAHRKEVWWYKLTGCDVLERAQIPCDWIPVFPVWGDELDIDGRVIRSGLVRNAKDPARMYNYWVTSATEEVSMRPKTPFIGAEGQFDGHEAKWAQANTRTFAYLEYNPIAANGMVVPPPQRQAMSDVPVGVLQMARHASDDIKATTGIFDASLGAQGNEKSGRAILARQKEGDTANFHFSDNLTRTLRHAGRCLVNMIPRIYDAQRVVRVMGQDEQIKSVTVNGPAPASDDDQAAQTVLHDLTVGKYDITVSAGPSYSTLRQEAAEAMIQFGQSWPKLMDVAGDKVVQAMDWPGADDIAERIARTIPPEIRGDEEGGQPQQGMVMTPQGPIPPEQAAQVMGQMKQAIDQMQAQLQEAKAGLDRERIKATSAEEVARIRADALRDVEELRGAVEMLKAQMQPPPALAAAALDGLHIDTPSDHAGNTESRPAPSPSADQVQEGMQYAEPGGDPGLESLG